MIIKTKLADGKTEFFNSSDYAMGTLKDLHPMILSATVFTDNGKRLKTLRRPFAWFYKHFTFKSEKVQNELKKISESQMIDTIKENSVEVTE